MERLLVAVLATAGIMIQLRALMIAHGIWGFFLGMFLASLVYDSAKRYIDSE